MTAQLLHVNGVALNAELREPEGEPRGTLVLIHGFTGSAAGWGAHLDAFARAGLRAIALDMLGHGASEAPADPARYAIERAGEDVVAALERLGVRRGEAALLGYSMGGRVALSASLSLSGYFGALLLESASPGLADERERAARRESDECLAASIERDGVPAFVDVWERLPLWASQARVPEGQRAALREQRLCNSAAGLANSLRGVGTGAQPSLWQRLGELRLPVLLVAGALDAKFARIAAEMAEHLPGARLRVVPDAGHAVHFERPDAFDALVIAFCSSWPRHGVAAATKE